MVEDICLVLSQTNPSLEGHQLVWPERGPIEAPDWNISSEILGGFRGFLWGQGDGVFVDWSPKAKWHVVQVLFEDIVDHQGWVRYPRGEILFTGPRKEALAYLQERNGGRPVLGVIAQGYDFETVHVGNYGKAQAGSCGRAIAGDGGSASSGEGGDSKAGQGGSASSGNRGEAVTEAYGRAQAGCEGRATTGPKGTAVTGINGKSLAGSEGYAHTGHGGTSSVEDGGMATAGICGRAVAGYKGTAIADDGGIAVAGDGGIAMVGEGGSAQAGHGGMIKIMWHDGIRRRMILGYIGEEGILPDTPYVVECGSLVPKGDSKQAPKA